MDLIEKRLETGALVIVQSRQAVVQAQQTRRRSARQKSRSLCLRERLREILVRYGSVVTDCIPV
jgi:hypothetical protein